MNIQKNVNGNIHELIVSGRVDGEGADQLEKQIIEVIRSGAQTVYINLSQATWLCSAGMRVLLQYWQEMKKSQKVLLVTRPSPEVATMIAESGFEDMLVEKI